MSKEDVVTDQDVKDGPAPGSDKTDKNAIPFERFNEVNERMKKAEAALQKILDDQQKAKDEDAKKRGEYEGLLKEKEDKLKAAEAEANQWKEYQSGRREALLSKLPEDQRELYSDLALDKLERHVELVVKSKTTSPGGTPGMPNNTGGFKSKLEAAQAFQRGEINLEKYREIEKQFDRH